MHLCQCREMNKNRSDKQKLDLNLLSTGLNKDIWVNIQINERVRSYGVTEKAIVYVRFVLVDPGSILPLLDKARDFFLSFVARRTTKSRDFSLFHNFCFKSNLRVFFFHFNKTNKWPLVCLALRDIHCSK